MVLSFLSPEKATEIQIGLGADIIMASMNAPSIRRTHNARAHPWN